MILGVILAGGKSSRFGSDKALAELGGQTLIARAVDTLSGWCEFVVVAGRATAPAPTLPDWPAPEMGPLGGLAAALHLACDEGYDAVLSLGVDTAGLPDDLPEWLGAQNSPISAAYVASQPVIGLWPVSVAFAIEAILTGTGRHSLRALVEMTSARAVKLPSPPANINTPADLGTLRGIIEENIIGSSRLEIDKATTRLDTAGRASLHECAHFVRLAIEAGNVKLPGYPRDAKNYGPTLTRAGFSVIRAEGYRPMKGDVVVFQPYNGGHPSGHIQMYDGTQWVSDFKQHGFWPGPGYQNNQAAYAIYRP